MVNKPKKANKTQTNIINSILPANKPQPKSRQQVNQENYQRNKERLKTQQKLNYAKKKEKEQEQLNKYYQASNIKILMSFKNYTELNKKKRKLWTDFNWTLKNCANDIKEGFGNIVSIMKLEQVTNKLVCDYWETAKTEERKGKSWNSLDYDEQQRLIRYWGYEKARVENNFLTTAEQLEKQSQSYLKEIELAKFHEQRGKIKCECWQCEESKQIKGKIKKELFKNKPEEKTLMVEGECANCFQYKKVDSESGLCKKCSADYGS